MSEIDPELDATWRAASREQPPAALDDAIRAAARREVGAKPGGLRASSRWLPLAAAAVVSVIAVGLVLMTPPERVTPATVTAASDAAQREVRPETDKPMVSERLRESPAAAAAPEAQRDTGKPSRNEQRRGAAGENGRGMLGRDRSESFAAAPDEQFQEKKAMASHQASPQRMDEPPARDQALQRKTELAAESSAARPSPAVSSPPAASGLRNEPQPFPATPVPAAPRASNGPDPMAATAPLSTLAPDEWIKLIRRLIAEGKNEDAAKELVAFRREYKERSDALLPGDLRAFRQ